MNKMTPEIMEIALNKLSELAYNEQKSIEIAVFGGSALALAFNLRANTKDIDAVFEKDKDFVNRNSKIVAEDMGLPEDWLNDGVKAYMSSEATDNVTFFKSYPNEENSSLRVYIPTPEYMLAMKCIDIRTQESHDIEDVKNLIQVCNLKKTEEVLDILKSFYPENMIQRKTEYVLDDIFENLDISNEASQKKITNLNPDYRKSLDKMKDIRKKAEKPSTNLFNKKI